MAYTGTGTQTDPYIVDNWTDFKALCGTTNKYIAFDPDAENKVIDMNDTEDCLGLSESLFIYAHVEGNGWEIRNLFTNTHTLRGSQNKINNLHFVNVLSNSVYLFFTGMNFTNCSFSVLFMTTPCFISATKVISAENCSFYFRFMDNAEGTVLFNSSVTLKNCDIVMDGTVRGLSLMNSGKLQNSRITGNLRLNGGKLELGCAVNGAQHNVYALQVTGEGEVSVTNAAGLICIMDTQIIADTLTLSLNETNWHGLTTAQMQDADYLMNTLNFPCVPA